MTPVIWASLKTKKKVKRIQQLKKQKLQKRVNGRQIKKKKQIQKSNLKRTRDSKTNDTNQLVHSLLPLIFV